MKDVKIIKIMVDSHMGKLYPTKPLTVHWLKRVGVQICQICLNLVNSLKTLRLFIKHGIISDRIAGHKILFVRHDQGQPIEQSTQISGVISQIVPEVVII